MRPRQASVLACVVLAGTSEGLARVLERARYKCCGTGWSWGIILVEILHSVEGGDVEQVCSNLETILPCLRFLISLSLVFIYLACCYCSSLYAWFILCSVKYMLEIVCPHLYLNQESYSSISTLNLEDLEEMVQSHSQGIQLHSLVILSVLA